MRIDEIGLFLLFSAIAAIPLIISLRLLKRRKAQMKKLQEIKDRIIELSKEKQQNQNKKKE